MKRASYEQFLSDLADLSRKHGIWVRAPFPTAQPILYAGYGEEKGYTLHELEGFEGYTNQFHFDREL